MNAVLLMFSNFHYSTRIDIYYHTSRHVDKEQK